MTILQRLALIFIFIGVLSCSSSSDDIEEALDTIDGVPRKPIDTSRLGVNAFANDARFGAISTQLSEVRDVLKLKFIRVLFAWNDAVQPDPNIQPNFSFYDEISNSIPDGVDAVVVITGLPGWMSNSSNWLEGNPRTTFVERWVKRIARRYASNPRIIAFQIWNEPNADGNPDNRLLELSSSPANYVEMLARAHNVVGESAAGKLVVGAATTSINQNFPATLNYNRGMKQAGAENFLDVWGVHYYGKQYERVIRPDGVRDFLNSLMPPIWVTESGEQGVNSQLSYGEEVWPFLLEKMPGIERIYVYQYTESTPADVTYGLKNISPDAPVSDLYVFLRDR